MSLPADHWQRALALMDTAVTLRPEQRDAWLEEMAAAEPQVAPLLRKLLSAHQRVETNDILATLPRPDRKSQHQSNGEIGAQIGPFELIELLGHGGMGSVWRARYADGRMKRDVAVKLPATSDNPAALASLRERFARERDFLAQLEHPNIARLYDTGISDAGQPYLAMEYVAGEPIDVYCDKHRLTIKARLTLYLQVLDAVEFAHRQLVLHRDLKPGNVLVDGSGQARLLDFGVAKLLPETSETSNTATSLTAGTDLTEMAGAAITLAYAAPEQINNGRLSTATDVYALGVMLYRLLTGSAPYQPTRDTRGALEDAVLTANPANASARFATTETLAARQTTEVALRRTLAGDIDTILAKALKKNADERYPTVAALAEDLRRHLAQLPITARPDSAWYRGNRFVARHRVAVTASALGIAALLVTTGVAVWQAQVATTSAARANKEAARATASQKFLAGLFANADPEQMQGNLLNAREILDRGMLTAERELADDPETLDLVLAQIGDIYFRLGLTEQNLAVQLRRVALIETQPQRDLNALVDARLALGIALRDSTETANNVQALAHVAATFTLAASQTVKPTLQVWSKALLANCYLEDGNLDDALRHGTEALALAEQTLPNPSPKLAGTLEILALVQTRLGQIAPARAHYLRAINIDETGKGRGRVDQINARFQLARLEYAAGNYVVARQQIYWILDHAKSNLGEVGSNLSAVRSTAVYASERAGELSVARQDVQTLLEPEFNSGVPSRVATALVAKARVEISSGQHDAAERDLSQAGAILQDSVYWRAVLTVLLAENALRQGDASTALARLKPFYDTDMSRLSALSNEAGNVNEGLGVAYARVGQFDVAREHIAQSCRNRVATRAPNHPQRVRCEAYQVLLSPQLAAHEKALALGELETRVAVGRADQIALLSSLRAAKATASQSTDRKDGGFLFAHLNFPLLD